MEGQRAAASLARDGTRFRHRVLTVRVVAVDWSGDRKAARKKIWTAESSQGQLEDLAAGRTPDEVANHLIALADQDANLVIGFDFAFSMPSWFVQRQGASSGPSFWDVVEYKGPRWLKTCPHPFFGHKGTKRPDDVELYRRTDREVPPIQGITPKSVFQIGGPGQVGPASIRGMPILRCLVQHGFHVWPFDTPAKGEPLVVEIYPRLLTGPVVKDDPEARWAALAQHANSIFGSYREVAAKGEDQFDAAVSAVVMDHYLDEIVALPIGDELDRIEGRIWHPGDRPGQSLPQ
jgi:hypothetical protein